ncbi:MAG TPA: enoyl-CoA hydratase/isomerase family protein, partial [Blastocatellia bacterium]|nr:enoyl-CoA hydratase/isomerase family protein [Blastocatellia bacterium]
MTEQVILTDVSDKVATLTLNRPEKLNALSPELIWQAVEALKLWSRDPDVGAIIVTGTGRAFCAGGDVSTMGRYEERGTLEQEIDRLRQA